MTKTIKKHEKEYVHIPRSWVSNIVVFIYIIFIYIIIGITWARG